MTHRNIEDMTPVEIVSHIKAKNLSVIYALSRHLVENKIMTTGEIYRVISDYGVKLDRSAVNKWLERA